MDCIKIGNVAERRKGEVKSDEAEVLRVGRERTARVHCPLEYKV